MKEQIKKTEETFSHDQQKVIDNLLDQWNIHNATLKRIEEKIGDFMLNKIDSENREERILAEKFSQDTLHNPLADEWKKEKQIVLGLESQMKKYNE